MSRLTFNFHYLTLTGGKNEADYILSFSSQAQIGICWKNNSRAIYMIPTDAVHMSKWLRVWIWCKFSHFWGPKHSKISKFHPLLQLLQCIHLGFVKQEIMF